ncbi:MAG: DMT family transporter, partial [Paracoccaceae bacterium]
MALSGLSEAAKGHLAMLIFSALVAGSFSFGSMIANQIDPVALTAARFVVAGAVIGTAAAVGPGLRLSHFRAPWRYLILGAVFGTYFVLMFEGLKTAPPISTAAVFTLTPVLSGIFGWLLVRQTTTPRMGAALAVGALGALWVIFRADLSAVVTLDIGRGEAIYFVGCVAHAAYPALVRRFHRGEPVLAFTLGMMVAALGVLLAYGWPAIRATDWAALPAQVWLVMLYLALFASTVTFLLLQFAALRLPSAKVMAYTYLTPSWVICWEAVLGHGLPRGLILVGVALTMGA